MILARPRKGGLHIAAQMVAGLEPLRRERVLQDIAKQDPQMAEAIRSSMVNLENLCDISIKMLVELLRDIKTEDLGLALRMGSAKLQKFILENVSSSIKKELKSIIDGPKQQENKILKASEKILNIVKDKLDRGEIVFKKKEDDEFV